MSSLMVSDNRFSMYDLTYRQGQESINFDSKRTNEYSVVLETIRKSIAENYAAELYHSIYEKGQESTLRKLITRHITQDQLTATGITNIAQLTDMIYDDMAGFGPVTQYLQDPDAEEININAYNKIYVQYPDRKITLGRCFSTSEECAETVRRMARNGGVILDGTNPIGDSFIARGVRMSGVVPPCVDSTIGAAASIRKQKPSLVTRDNLLRWGTATAEELEFLTLCINCDISMAIVGETGSGKTSDMNLLLSSSKPTKRKYFIEDTREASLDEEHDAVYILTKEQAPAVTMNDGLRLALRFDPDIIVPSEMRGAEANTAVEAGRTGHTIISTLHANSAISAYDRILTMCQQSGTTLSEERLLKNIIEAFPIMVYKTRLPDGSRKYMEIFEATGLKDGVVYGNMIFRFEVDRHEYDETGEVLKTHGKHVRVGDISEKLERRLRERGANPEQIQPFLRH